MNSLFITGTDTGIGKTQVSCLIIRQLVDSGLRVAGMKPVASGAQRVDGQYRNEDALALIAAANVDAPYEWVNPFCYEPPIAPHIAAQQSGQAISIARIQDCYTHLATISEVQVVEGVGGWSVPIDQTSSMADVAAALDLPVVMVVGLRLGCLNHAALTTQAIRARGMRLAGWVANGIDNELAFREQNIETLRAIIDAPLLGVIPYLSNTRGWQSVSLDLDRLVENGV